MYGYRVDDWKGVCWGRGRQRAKGRKSKCDDRGGGRRLASVGSLEVSGDGQKKSGWWKGPLVSAKRTNQRLRSIISIPSSLGHPPTTSTLSSVNQMPFSPFSIVLVRCRVGGTHFLSIGL